MIRLHESLRALFYAPLYAALARDAFARAGVALTVLSAAAPDAAPAAIAAGSADVAWGGPMRLVAARRDDPASDLRLFAEFVCRDPFLVLGRDVAPGMAPAALCGMELAGVTEVPTPLLCLRQDIRDGGADPAALQLAPPAPMAVNAARVQAGAVALAQLFEPYATLAEQGGCAVAYAAATRGVTAYTGLYARAGTIAARRDEILALARGLAAGLDFAANAPLAEFAAALSPFFPDLEPALIARCLARYRRLGIWPRGITPSRRGYARLARALEGGGFTPRTPGFARIADRSIAAECAAG
ncbi:MAG: ABC transporter substrate-binding protein [Rhodospirillales bacterium]|nr:ABC transporter substrate-binding protein [Rhodospirillales bacterium]